MIKSKLRVIKYKNTQQTNKQSQCNGGVAWHWHLGRLIVDQQYNKRNALHNEDLGRLIVDQEYNKRNALHNEDLGRLI